MEKQLKDNLGNEISPKIDYVFEWDGKNSNTNPDNLELWQNIYDKQKERVVLVLVNNGSYYPTIFCISKNQLTKTGSRDKTVNSTYNSGSTGIGDSYTTEKIFWGYTILSLEDDTVNSVQELNSNWTGISYLDPTMNYSKPYTPKYNSSPATKKYVDDNVPIESGWHIATITNSHFTSITNNPLRYRSIGRIVEIRGSVYKVDDEEFISTALFNLPADYCPTAIISNVCQVNNSINRFSLEVWKYDSTNSDISGLVQINSYGAGSYIDTIPKDTTFELHIMYMLA